MNNFIWKNKITEGYNPVTLLLSNDIKQSAFKSNSGWDSTMNFTRMQQCILKVVYFI
jgi:hypothetical protein